MVRGELQQQREPRPGRPRLAGNQALLPIEYRPVIDQLVQAGLGPLHGRRSSPPDKHARSTASMIYTVCGW